MVVSTSLPCYRAADRNLPPGPQEKQGNERQTEQCGKTSRARKVSVANTAQEQTSDQQSGGQKAKSRNIISADEGKRRGDCQPNDCHELKRAQRREPQRSPKQQGQILAPARDHLRKTPIHARAHHAHSLPKPNMLMSYF